MKIYTFTDESGQDTGGRFFLVATIIVKSEDIDILRRELKSIEDISRKYRKWSKSGKKQRYQYLDLFFRNNIFSNLSFYYSVYADTKNYQILVASHIAKAILQHTKTEEYEAKIIIDKIDKHSLLILRQELRSYNIRRKKIVGTTEQADAIIRLADTFCGCLRDKDTLELQRFYKKLLKLAYKV